MEMMDLNDCKDIKILIIDIISYIQENLIKSEICTEKHINYHTINILINMLANYSYEHIEKDDYLIFIKQVAKTIDFIFKSLDERKEK
jgi:hypothetical protein